MAKPGEVGLTRIVHATRYSYRGLVATWRNESAFRQESVLALVLTPAAFYWGATPVETALMITTLFIVLIVELLNSAVEATVDRIGPEHHELAGLAKDIGSAAVFMSLALVVCAWLIIFVG